MLVIAVCAALVAVGAVIVVRRGGARQEGPVGWPRYIAASLAAGLAAGVLAAGAGGRLVMRLLGATSPDAHGSLTPRSARPQRIRALCNLHVTGARRNVTPRARGP